MGYGGVCHGICAVRFRYGRASPQIGRLLAKDGKSQAVLKVLPGHDGKHYEFRYGRALYRVDRAAFLEALRKLGIAAVPT